MTYLKSILVGLAALLTCALVVPMVVLLVPTTPYRPVVDPAFLAQWPATWLFAAVIFGAGFYWEFQRAKGHVSNKDSAH
ncbi:MAG TPA: hypothetical protein VET69_06455 [Terriglobales bacterium]|nr:hypothetical protein [Terriglobales bacterium]